MATLSLCMIVKNEEDVLGRCLSCVKNIVDEIIIVDTGSTDSTKKVAAQFTDKVYDFEWIDDFSAARNYSFSKATMDYIMWLDADDVIDNNNRYLLKVLLDGLEESTDIVMMKYNVAFDENQIPTYSYYRERILKRVNNYKWVGEIHEVIIPSGNILYKDIGINHKKTRPNQPDRNLKIYKRMIRDGKILEPRHQFYYARELKNNGYVDRAIKEYIALLQDGTGWIENNISACIDLSQCYKEKGDEYMEITSLFRSFIYDEPRAEICCDIGSHFLERKNYKNAIFWYKLAASSKIKDTEGGFLYLDCYDFIPNIQLCVCYDRLGDHEKAYYYNEEAGKFKPNSPNYIHNKEYFERILKA